MAGLSDIFGASSEGDTSTGATTDEAKVENGPDNPDPRFADDDGTGDTSGTDAATTSSFDDAAM